MPASKAGALRIDVSADTVQFDKGMSNVQRSLASAGKRFEALGAKAADWGKKLSLAATLPIAGIAAASIKGAQAQAAAMAQVDAAIASMGNAARLSGDELSKFADSLELKSLFDADEILKSSTANLLTFGNISGDVFKRAQQAAVDLATRMDGDLKGATIQIGKALNDPAKGLSALSKAGIQFTAQQKEQIKAMQAAGDIAGAQAIMLGELERQFGGAAAAAAKVDPMREVMVKLGQAGDQIGEKLLPLIPPLTDAIVKVLDAFTKLSPAMQQVVLVGGGIAAALGPALVVFGTMFTGIGKLLPLLTKLPLLLNAVGVAFRFMLGPIGLAITAIGAIYLAWKNWDKIEPIIRNLYNGVKTWIMDKLGAVWDWLKAKLAAVGQWFYNLYDAVVGHSYIPDMVDQIGRHIARLDGNMVQPIKGMTAKAAEAFRQLQTDIGAIMARLFPEAAQVESLMGELSKLDSDMAKKMIDPAVWAEARARLVEELSKAQTAAAKSLSDGQAARVGIWTSDEADAELARMGESADDSGGIAQIAPALETGKEKSNQLAESLRAVGGAGDSAMHRVAGAVGDLIANLKNAESATMSLGDKMSGIAGAAETLFGAIFGEKVGKIAGAVAGIASAFFGGGGFGGFRASGGPVASGKAYVVGERGPELFMPGRSGAIVPSLALSGIPRGVSLDQGGYINPGRGGDVRPVRLDVVVHESPKLLDAVQVTATEAGGRAATGVVTTVMKRQARRAHQRLA